MVTNRTNQLVLTTAIDGDSISRFNQLAAIVSSTEISPVRLNQFAITYSMSPPPVFIYGPERAAGKIGPNLMHDMIANRSI